MIEPSDNAPANDARADSPAPNRANPESPAPDGPAPDTWEGILANLRRRYPGQKDSVLFCVHKLHANPELGLADFREEAQLHGIPMAGRALHSAKVLLGLAESKPRAKRPPTAAPAVATTPEAGAAPGAAEASAGDAPVAKQPRRARREPAAEDGSIETQVLDAVRQIQSAAGAEADKLRAAMREAITILQRALDE